MPRSAYSFIYIAARQFQLTSRRSARYLIYLTEEASRRRQGERAVRRISIFRGVASREIRTRNIRLVPSGAIKISLNSARWLPPQSGKAAQSNERQEAHSHTCSAARRPPARPSAYFRARTELCALANERRKYRGSYVIGTYKGA